MRFGIFYEHQLPRPWSEDSEYQLLQDALEQVEIADKVGFHHVWEVEHHYLEEYSHSSAPEVFLAAASQRTKNIRLGHGIIQLPQEFNHTARVAERIATLDLISGGRVDFGTGESTTAVEIDGFNVDKDTKRDQWEEAVDAVSRMFVEAPFAGYDGRFLKMPPRNVIPKPRQKPHPPMWVACSRRETIHLAAQKGLGALSFAFVEAAEAKTWVDDYEATICSEECVPATFSVTPRVSAVLPMMCHYDEDVAIDRGIDGGHFFGYSLLHYVAIGRHRPGRTNLWEEFQERRSMFGFDRETAARNVAELKAKVDAGGDPVLRGAIGTPQQILELCRAYRAAGVDELIFVSQAGNNKHEHICESLEIFGKEVMPEFLETAEEDEARKMERLQPFIDKALARRSGPRSVPEDYDIPSVPQNAAPQQV